LEHFDEPESKEILEKGWSFSKEHLTFFREEPMANLKQFE
jgi:hypothetical protein